MPSQKKALTDIAACMTAQMGGHQYQCRDCENRFWVYHGCRNHQRPDPGHGRYPCDLQIQAAGTGQWRTCRLTGVEFLRRFLMHVLPKGFHKVRYYGLWHPSKRDLQQRAWLLLSLLAPDRGAESLLIADVAAEADRPGEDENTSAKGFSPSCPHCGSRQVEHLQERCRGPGP